MRSRLRAPGPTATVTCGGRATERRSVMMPCRAAASVVPVSLRAMMQVCRSWSIWLMTVRPGPAKAASMTVAKGCPGTVRATVVTQASWAVMPRRVATSVSRLGEWPSSAPGKHEQLVRVALHPGQRPETQHRKAEGLGRAVEGGIEQHEVRAGAGRQCQVRHGHAGAVHGCDDGLRDSRQRHRFVGRDAHLGQHLPVACSQPRVGLRLGGENLHQLWQLGPVGQPDRQERARSGQRAAAGAPTRSRAGC